MYNPTIKDVAKEAGVSIATVSRVINSKGYITPEIKMKVDRAISVLQYKPNSVARSLRNKSTFTIGLVVTDIANPFFMLLAKELENTVSVYDYNVIICGTEENQEKELKYLNMLASKQVDGIVISSTGKNNTLLSQLNESGIPIVLIDRKNDDLDLDLVKDDNVYGGYILVKHLIQKGHTKIALIKGHPMSTTSEERCQGYYRALAEAGIKKDPNYAFIGGRSGESASDATRSILAMNDGPTAIFAVNNLIAKNVIMVLNSSGKKVPQDMSIVCYGLEEFKTLFNPSITCILQNPGIIGMKAGELIIKRIRDKSLKKRSEIILLPEFYNGNSV